MATKQLTLLILLVAIIAVVSARKSPGGKPGGGSGGSRYAILAPTPCESAVGMFFKKNARSIRGATKYCLRQQQGIVDVLKEIKMNGGMGSDPVVLLLESGNSTYVAMGEELRKCFFDRLSLLAADDTFDTDALKQILTTALAGSPIAANVQVGLDGCPAVTNFDLRSYLACLVDACETGTAPP